MRPEQDYLKAKPFRENTTRGNRLYAAFVSLFSGSPRVVPVHYHEALEIIIPFNAYGETVVSGKPFPLRHGQAHVMRPDSIHAFRIGSYAAGEVYVLHLHARRCELFFSQFKGFERTAFQTLLQGIPVVFPGDSAQLISLIKSLSQLTGINDNAALQAASDSSSLFQILSLLMEKQGQTGEKSKDLRIRRILDVIQALRNRPTCLAEIAEKSALSKYHLCRLFKAATGTTIQNYLTEIRINQAAEFLGSGKMNVTEACFESGFENLSYFIQVFRKIMGKTPKQWALETLSKP